MIKYEEKVLLKLKAMKKLIITSMIALLLAGVSTIRANDWPEEYLGLPGDNLNLYAVMDLFQKSETLEGFERDLNAENTRINNLDLNGDNLVDYIMVSDYVDGDVHNIVLRVALNRNEYQDVAVFTVQKYRDGSVAIQLIGDEALYGKNYIIEPIYAETPNPGYRGSTRYINNYRVVTTTYYDIGYWPVVRYIYTPGYIVWRSMWYWGYWPAYWYSWTPYYWHYYYGYHYNWFDHYYAHYHHCDYYRYHGYNDYYYSNVRMHSPHVDRNIHNGTYKTTYSRPDQRKQGEALYAREHNGQKSTANQGRMTASNGNENRTYNSSGRSTGYNSRSTATVTNKSTGSYSNGRNTETTSRSKSTGTNKSLGNTSTGRSSGTVNRTSTTSHNSGTVNRSTTSSHNKSLGNTSTGRSNGTVNRSTTSSHSSGTVNRSTTTSHNKSMGSTSGSRSSGSVNKSTSTSHKNGSGSTSADRSTGSTHKPSTHTR